MKRGGIAVVLGWAAAGSVPRVGGLLMLFLAAFERFLCSRLWMYWAVAKFLSLAKALLAKASVVPTLVLMNPLL